MHKTLLVWSVLASLSMFAVSSFALDASGVFAKVSPSVVVVDILDGQGKSLGIGSGVVVGKNQVITNCHVAQKSQSVQVRQSSKTFNATIHYADPNRDLCQLNVPNLQVPSITLGSAKVLKVGQRVYAIGAPKGFELTLSEGLVSSLREYEGSQYIQTSAAISPGSSGGGLFDEEGRLIGITTFYITEGQNLNFALPVDWINELPKRAQLNTAKLNENGLHWFNKALFLEQQKDWQGLLKLSQDWLRKEPENADAWAFSGEAYHSLKEYDKAIYSYRMSYYRKPATAELWDNLGSAFSNVGRYAQAITAHKKAIEIKPDLDNAWNNLGFTYNKNKQYDLALQAHVEALRINPKSDIFWNNLGMDYNGLSQTEHAIAAYKEALQINPENVDALNNLGINYYLKGETGKVRDVYLILKNLDPIRADKYFKSFVIP